MNLKDQMQSDLDLLFNIDELASEHMLCDRKLTVIVDNDQMQRNSMKAPGGIYDGDLLLFLKTADLVGLRLEPDRMVSFDQRPYQVSGVFDEDGVTQLTLRTNRGF